jgi:hypothetical protein
MFAIELDHAALEFLSRNAKPQDCGRAHVSAYVRHVNNRAADLMLATLAYDVERGFTFGTDDACVALGLSRRDLSRALPDVAA